jgi:hypothetical protein
VRLLIFNGTPSQQYKPRSGAFRFGSRLVVTVCPSDLRFAESIKEKVQTF